MPRVQYKKVAFDYQLSKERYLYISSTIYCRCALARIQFLIIILPQITFVTFLYCIRYGIYPVSVEHVEIIILKCYCLKNKNIGHRSSKNRRASQPKASPLGSRFYHPNNSYRCIIATQSIKGMPFLNVMEIS